MKNPDPTVLFHVDGHIATITLNNAQRHNALGREEITSLSSYLTQIHEDKSVRVLLLTGSGERTFCAGAALDQLSSGQISPEQFAGLTRQLAELRVPSICVLNGSVYGGGCELALSCDFRFARDGIRAFIPASKFGLCYPPSGIERLVLILGLSKALRFLLSAEEFPAQQLLEMGFLSELCSGDELIAHAQDYAHTLASRAPLAVQAMKSISLQAARSALDMVAVQALVDQCNQSRDLAEGLAASKEKRQPVFSGL